MDGSSDHTDSFWINQNDLNYISFEFDALYEPPPLSHRPIYVHSSDFGIVGSDIYVNISKISRSGSPIRDVAFTRRYDCPGVSNNSPNKDVVKCTITEKQFYTNMENGDWFDVEFTAKSGGYRKLVNLNNPTVIWHTQYYLGQTDTKRIVFKFDFEVPNHCSENISVVGCSPGDLPLRIENEFTKSPINISWGGWADNMSGMKRYHIEVFKLSPDAYNNLVESTPLSPIYSDDVNHTLNNIYYYTYIPRESGMFSVLLQASDMANNSKIARRLFLYDPFSNISLNEEEDSKLFVASAVPETGYIWQTAKNGTNTEITVEWTNHFANKFISDGKWLNKVEDYPIQFQDIERDGILRSLKFVYPGLDDNEGERTMKEKPNKNGVHGFEVNTVFTDETSEPANGWVSINGLNERYTISENLRDGRTVRFWVRAYDVLGNRKTDNTEVHFDSTPPRLSKNPATFLRNQNGTYNRTSR
ncbi:hypothetical protein CHS0354_042998 [Potamilus streckersoni]|uniref:Uncharacterized protein n=1 Tax=Potamilus streckersoni TaxID=2493646 RepID=A0AAE0W6D2_9BIVA|nr:hypothetical protein CHS0354_042998 [Potamilus streckersoni]